MHFERAVHLPSQGNADANNEIYYLVFALPKAEQRAARVWWDDTEYSVFLLFWIILQATRRIPYVFMLHYCRIALRTLLRYATVVFHARIYVYNIYTYLKINHLCEGCTSACVCVYGFRLDTRKITQGSCPQYWLRNIFRHPPNYRVLHIFLCRIPNYMLNELHRSCVYREEILAIVTKWNLAYALCIRQRFHRRGLSNLPVIIGKNRNHSVWSVWGGGSNEITEPSCNSNGMLVVGDFVSIWAIFLTNALGLSDHIWLFLDIFQLIRASYVWEQRLIITKYIFVKWLWWENIVTR